MSASIDPTTLREAAQRLVDDGLPACQVAVARDRELLMFETFGDATDTTRFRVASATKPIVGSAVLALIGGGQLDVTARVVDFIPEFGTHGKDVVTIEQLMVFSCGFPRAVMPSPDGSDRALRVARFQEWELDWEPGTRFEYHPGSAHWVMAELIDRVSGIDFRDFIEQRVTQPLGLPRLLGFGPGEQGDIAGLTGADGSVLDQDDPGPIPETERLAMIEAGTPGGGGVMTAASLALFYQGLLHNPDGLWKPDLLADATTNIRNSFLEPTYQLPANRTIACLVIGNGFASQWVTLPHAFGHPGAGGQFGYADPDTGLSVAFAQRSMPGDDAAAPFARAHAIARAGGALR
jgi:CubicO group peptidase (beta-lactamase class C family)